MVAKELSSMHKLMHLGLSQLAACIRQDKTSPPPPKMVKKKNINGGVGFRARSEAFWQNSLIDLVGWITHILIASRLFPNDVQMLLQTNHAKATLLRLPRQGRGL
jgi:hypothetical protein